MLRPGADVVAAARRPARLHRVGRPRCSPTPAASRCSRSSPKVDDDGVTFRSTYDGSLAPAHARGRGRAPRSCSAPTSRWCSTSARRCRRPPDVVAPRRRAHRGVGARGPGRRTAATTRRCSASCRAASTRCCARPSAPPHRRRSASTATASAGCRWGRPAPRCCRRSPPPLAELPADRPRYLMGVGDPARAGRGRRPRRRPVRLRAADPARPPRHRADRRRATVNLRNARYADDDGPLDDRCALRRCAPATSRGYLRHLLAVGEPTASRLVSCTTWRGPWT